MARKMAFFIVCFVVMLCSCSGSQAGASSVIITEPGDGTVVQVGDLVTFRTEMEVAAGVNRVDLIVNGELVRSDSLGTPLFSGSLVQAWRPDAEGIFEVYIAAVSEDHYAASSEVSIQVAGLPVEPVTQISDTPAQQITDTATQTSTVSPSVTPSITATAQAVDPYVQAESTTNCRAGDDGGFRVLVTLADGESAPIIGRNQQSTWWLVRESGNDCWVADHVVGVYGDTSRVPVVASPPTTTPTSEPLRQPGSLSPQGVIECADTTGGIILSWSPVSHPDGISGYEWSIEGGGITNSGTTSDTQVKVHTIACFSSYSWRVRTVGSDGDQSSYAEAEFIVE